MHSALGVRIKQTWQKRYLVLRDSWTEDGDTSLELYTCSDSGKCHTVSLRHVMLVDVYHDSKSFPHAFIVFRSVNLCLFSCRCLYKTNTPDNWQDTLFNVHQYFIH